MIHRDGYGDGDGAFNKKTGVVGGDGNGSGGYGYDGAGDGHSAGRGTVVSEVGGIGHNSRVVLACVDGSDLRAVLINTVVRMQPC